jgi:carbonic anhydrase
MGHTHCGAVAAVAGAKGEPLPGNQWIFQVSMAGLLESAPQKPGESDEAYQVRLVETNVVRQARFLVQRSEHLREQVQAGKLKVVPALYDLDSGRVIFLEDPGPAAS